VHKPKKQGRLFFFTFRIYRKKEEVGFYTVTCIAFVAEESLEMMNWKVETCWETFSFFFFC
jgi:hypothetical protein